MIGSIDCKQDPIYVLPELKLRGLVPNFHIHVPVSDLYISTQYSRSSKIGGLIVGIYKSSQIQCMKVGIGNDAPQFNFWEYLFKICGTVSCSVQGIEN
jgi:hypothetical protein